MICGLRHSRSAPKKEIRREISWGFFKTGLIFMLEDLYSLKTYGVEDWGS